MSPDSFPLQLWVPWSHSPFRHGWHNCDKNDAYLCCRYTKQPFFPPHVLRETGVSADIPDSRQRSRDAAIINSPLSACQAVRQYFRQIRRSTLSFVHWSLPGQKCFLFLNRLSGVKHHHKVSVAESFLWPVEELQDIR